MSSQSNKALFTFIRISFSMLILVAVIYCTVRVSEIGYEFGYRVFTEPAVSAEPGRDIPVMVKDDMSDREVAKMLEEKGLIRDKNLGFLQIKLSAYSGKFIPGVYNLNTSMQIKEMLIVMSTEAEEMADELPTAGEEEGTAPVSMETETTEEESAP